MPIPAGCLKTKVMIVSKVTFDNSYQHARQNKRTNNDVETMKACQYKKSSPKNTGL